MNLRITLLGVILSVILGSAQAKKADDFSYELNRSAKICATGKMGTGCGTGAFLSPRVLVTAWHVIAPFQVPVLKVGPGGLGASLDTKDQPPDEIVVYSYKHPDRKLPVKSIFEDKIRDLAIIILTEDSGSPAAPVSRVQPVLGSTVTLVGNPYGQSFAVVKTVIVDQAPFTRDDGSVVTEVIVDSKDGAIRPGFSGGAMFDEQGNIVGILEWGNTNPHIGGGPPGFEILKTLADLKKSKSAKSQPDANK